MSYDHSLTVSLVCRDSATEELLLKALEPICVELCCKAEDLRSEPGEEIGLRIHLFPDGSRPNALCLDVAGDVGDSYEEVVKQVARNLTPLCHPGAFELRDHDTADLESSITRIWVGEGADLIEFQRMTLLADASEILSKAGCFTSNQISELHDFAMSMPVVARRDLPAPRG